MRSRSLSATEARVVLSLEESRTEDVTLETIERFASDQVLKELHQA